LPLFGCDPCAGNPLSKEELRSLGVFWQDDQGAQPVFLTRLHIRYSRATFPEDLVFQETKDEENFQARYVLRHPFKGREDCAEAQAYYRELKQRHETEAETLAGLTGWDVNQVRTRMGLDVHKGNNWWDKIWDQPATIVN
jgi:hypothetical protein